jgi:hypothetical protein
MRANTAFAAVILIAGTLVVAAAAPVPDQWWGRRTETRGLTVWADVEFRGADHTFVDDVADIGSTGMARTISSLRPGQGETWQVCTERNYAGRCRIFSGSVSNLQEIGWNDVIMSVRRLTGAGYAAGRTGANLPPAAGLELYAGHNFTGRRVVLRQTTSDFRSLNFNDMPVSARVPANTVWEVCVDVDFEQCRQISGDIPNLDDVGLSGVMSSARPIGDAMPNRGYWGRGQPRQPTTEPRLVVFDNPNFTGRRVTIQAERASMLGTPGSIQVIGGRWQLCDRPNFGGNCVMVTGDISDTSELNLRGPVASLRPR